MLFSDKKYYTDKIKDNILFGDAFGRTVNLTFLGSTKFKTWPGAVATVLMKLIMLYFVVSTFLKVWFKSPMSLNVEESWINLDENEGVNL